MRKLFTVVLGVASVAGCVRNIDLDQFTTPQEMLDAAVAEKERGNCVGATPVFRRVLLEFSPRDLQTATARFHLAECLVEDNQYVEASRQFRRVANEFPTGELAALALLRSGDALAQLWKRPELDPTYGQSAMAAYTELLNRYPLATEADSARQRSNDLSNRFAVKEFRTGRYYYRHGAYDSAIIYFRNVVGDYPRADVVPAALLTLVDIYRRLGYEQEREETCQLLFRFHSDTPGLAESCTDDAVS
ncbi:MAG: outer membrane protein assembly factor BamD [Gemmatimonadetes bacterium]|nr:outer membrane protein assembly factor BamD [Gemmatimonadota bacterium]